MTEPQATSHLLWRALLVLHPGFYADLLGKRRKEHQAKCWLSTRAGRRPLRRRQRLKINPSAHDSAILNRRRSRMSKPRPDTIFGAASPLLPRRAAGSFIRAHRKTKRLRPESTPLAKSSTRISRSSRRSSEAVARVARVGLENSRKD